MKRSLSATLRYLRSDLSVTAAGAALLSLLSLALGGLMFLLESPEDAAMMVTAVMAGGGALLTLVLTIVYFSNWYTVLLAFPLTRRGLLAGILLFCLGASALMQLAALVLGTLCTLVLGAALGCTLAMPWQVTPWFVWPLALLAPVLPGLILGGLQCRFGPRAFWVMYFVFILICSTTGQWMPWLTTRFPPAALTGLIAALCAAVPAMALLSVRWLLRASVR